MSLRYITGKTGTGKTELCIDEITKCNTLDNRVFYIVPEQFTLESEKRLLSKKSSLVNINVLGFRHFAYYLISKMGMGKRVMLDESGRAMLIRRIVLELKNKLGFYKNSADRQGFIDSIDMTLTELMQYGISLAKIDETLLDMKDGNLKNKLKDIRLIFEKYREYMNMEYIAGDGALELLAEYIEDSVVKDSVVWIDGFKSFTPQENKVIEKLVKYCKRVTIAFTLSRPAVRYGSLNPFDEEYEVKRAVTKISDIAEENGVEIEPVVYMDKQYKKYCDEIEFIKDNYFKHRFVPYNKEVKNIAVYRATDMYSEMYRICSEIKALVQYKGYRYSDIVLITGSEDYERPLSDILKKFDIPNFLDGRKEISSHSLIVFIMGIIDTVAYGWNNESVFRMLKTGYSGIESERIYTIENYVVSNGINRYKWQKEWKYGFKEKENSSKPEKEYIYETKEMILELMAPLNENFKVNKKAKVRDITLAVIGILEKVNVSEKIESDIKEAEDKGDRAKAVFCSKIWSTVTDVFEKLTGILGDEKVTMKEYSGILSAGFEKTSVGIAPAVQDCLIVGDMERTRLPDIKAMFIIGANEGNIPVQIGERGAFKDDERLTLEDNGMEMAPGIVQMMNNGRLSIYMNLIKPAEYLALSYPVGNLKGENLKPSSVVIKIESMFTQLKETEAEKIDYNTLLTGKAAAFDALIDGLCHNDNSEFMGDLFKYYFNDEEYKNKIGTIEKGILSQLPQKYIDKKLLPALWDNVVKTTSVSRLERFSGCPFKFYMEYILKAKDREVYSIRNSDIGTLSHRVMESFAKYIRDEGVMWEDTDKTYTDAYIESHIGEFIKGMDTDIFETKRNSTILSKIKEALKYSLWANAEQVKASKFKPENFEISFGNYGSDIPSFEIEIDDGRIMRLHGVIDRVDKMIKEDGSIYVKIVDYKSSSKKLDVGKISCGLQLQLAMYMNAVVNNNKSKAGGMFYFEVNEPELAEKDEKNLSFEDFMLKRLALNGIYDQSIEEELDSAFYESYDGRKKAMIKLLRDISKNGSIGVSEENMNELLELAKDTAKKAASEMAQGNIEISPLKYADEDPCKYCPYSKVCDVENCKENVKKL